MEISGQPFFVWLDQIVMIVAITFLRDEKKFTTVGSLLLLFLVVGNVTTIYSEQKKSGTTTTSVKHFLSSHNFFGDSLPERTRSWKE